MSIGLSIRTNVGRFQLTPSCNLVCCTKGANPHTQYPPLIDSNGEPQFLNISNYFSYTIHGWVFVDKFYHQLSSLWRSNLSQLAAAERKAGILTGLWHWHHLGNPVRKNWIDFEETWGIRLRLPLEWGWIFCTIRMADESACSYSCHVQI